MPRVLVVGSANTDMVVKSASIPRPGETILGGQFVMARGGKGANQAVQAARLGASTRFVGCLGQDAFGDLAIAGMQADGIDTSYVFREPAAPSGVALIMVDAHGENCIAVAPGANAKLSPERIRDAAEAIKDADVAVVQLEIPLETVHELAKLCNKYDTKLILNPAPAVRLSESLLVLVDVLTPNEHEARLLTGIRESEEPRDERVARRLLSLGAKSVLVTVGDEGAVVCTPDETRHAGTPIVDAVDTTAAGDAFNGALAVKIAEGVSLHEAAEYACKVAAIACTRLGAQPSLPTRQEVDAFSPSTS